MLDAALDIEKFATAAGIVESAVRELIELAPFQFKAENGVLIHTATRLPMAAYVESLRKTKPHYWPEATLDDEEAAAFGADAVAPMKARGAYMLKYGPEKFAEAMDRWGASHTRQGERASDEDETGNKSQSKNPWSDAFKGDDKARQAKITSIIKTLGTATAASMAKAAGKRIDGRPLVQK